MGVRGYKVFNPDWTCRDFQYKVGETYEYDGDIGICHAGFHFCRKIANCFSYYDFDSNNKVAEVEAIGSVIIEKDKSVTNKLKIVRELSWQEVLDLVNMGKGNTGYHNTGDFNSGKWNTGNFNSGCCNTGRCNIGNRNSGDCNSGVDNSGDWNSGFSNSGNHNTGYRNTGNYNKGCYNTGNYNTGDYNVGDWNSTDFTTGFFNSIKQPLYVFNKPTNISREDFYELPTVKAMIWKFDNSDWIYAKNMTEDEKINHPEYETTGGYLKIVDYKTACSRMWERMTDDEKAAVRDIPNFDPEVFKEITGIDINLKT